MSMIRRRDLLKVTSVPGMAAVVPAAAPASPAPGATPRFLVRADSGFRRWRASTTRPRQRARRRQGRGRRASADYATGGENAIHSITLSCNVSANKRGVSELWSHPGGEIRRLQDRFAIRPIVRYAYLIGASSQRRGTN